MPGGGRAGVGVDKDMRLGPGNLDNYLGFLTFVCIETCDTLDLQRNFSPHSVKLESLPHYKRFASRQSFFTSSQGSDAIMILQFSEFFGSDIPKFWHKLYFVAPWYGQDTTCPIHPTPTVWQVEQDLKVLLLWVCRIEPGCLLTLIFATFQRQEVEINEDKSSLLSDTFAFIVIISITHVLFIISTVLVILVSVIINIIIVTDILSSNFGQAESILIKKLSNSKWHCN